MSDGVVPLLASVGALICVIIILLQILLVLGLPLGTLTMGGKHRILPVPLRFASGLSAVLLGFIGYLLLQQTNLLPVIIPYSLSKTVLWVFTVYLGINVLANLLSRSKWERFIMTPLALILFVACFMVSMYST